MTYSRKDDDRHIGWHMHGSHPVWGIWPNDGCELCDKADAFWWPNEVAEIEATPRYMSDDDIVAVLRARQHVPVELETIRVVVEKADTLQVVEQKSIAFVETKAAIVSDNEVSEPEPEPEPAPVAFKLTPPTAESIRKNRRGKR